MEESGRVYIPVALKLGYKPLKSIKQVACWLQRGCEEHFGEEKKFCPTRESNLDYSVL